MTELWRLVIRDQDPVELNTAFVLETEFVGLANPKCKDFKATYKLVRLMDSKSQEYQEKSGKVLEERLERRVLWQGMDDETMEPADSKGLAGDFDENDDVD